MMLSESATLLFIVLFIVIIIVLVIAELILKGFAMWRASERGDKAWFWVILILNTLGILPLIYLLVTNKEESKKSKTKKSNTWLIVLIVLIALFVVFLIGMVIAGAIAFLAISSSSMDSCAQDNPFACVGVSDGTSIPSCDPCNTCTCQDDILSCTEMECLE